MILFSFKTDCAKPELETIGTRKIESGSLVKISQYLETSSELQDETDFNSGLFPYTNPSGLIALKKSFKLEELLLMMLPFCSIHVLAINPFS